MNGEPLHLTTENEVMYYDTDCGGVVHNLAYMRMIEECRTKLGKLMGMDYRQSDDNRIFAVVVRHEIDYIRPGVMGDTLVTKGWISAMEKASFWCDFEMYRKSDNTLLVKAHQKLALVRMPSGRPTRIPDEWRQKSGLV